ncbi:MAG: hypothetical protein HYY15_00830 [Candidatus Omnitrophica bacterium]|nr:hypothetical protein [Candidatus Omnitrophota bacterium]
MADGARQRHITLFTSPKTGDNTDEPVAIHPVPWLLSRAHAVELQAISLRLREAITAVLSNYLADPALQQVLPLDPDERAWLADVAPKGPPTPIPIFERLDTNLILERRDGLRRFKILEWNSVGVGCLHFLPMANQLVAEHVLPTLRPAVKGCPIELSADPRHLLMHMLRRHAQAIRRPCAVTAFVERREMPVGGSDEMLFVSQYLQQQGLPTVVADPRELEWRRDELMYKDIVVDLLYRDCSLSELISIERHGGDVTAMREAFRRNRVISALAGEFDHKSLCEVLSSPEFARYFTPAQRRMLRVRVPWTRLLRERKTTDLRGRLVDLPVFARRHRDRLVLKPNRSYGGQGVAIGSTLTQSAWDGVLKDALARPDTWVVQETVPLPRVTFLDGRGGSKTAPEFVIVGVMATADGVAFLGRSSPQGVVNISQGGRLVPILLTA